MDIGEAPTDFVIKICYNVFMTDSIDRVSVNCPLFAGSWPESGSCCAVLAYRKRLDFGELVADPVCTRSDKLDYVEIGASPELAKARREAKLHDIQPDLVWSDGSVQNGSPEVVRRAGESRCAYVSMYCVERRKSE